MAYQSDRGGGGCSIKKHTIHYKNKRFKIYGEALYRGGNYSGKSGEAGVLNAGGRQITSALAFN